MRVTALLLAGSLLASGQAAWAQAVTVNRSGTIGMANVFQPLSTLAPPRKGCTIQNPPDATETLYVDVGESPANKAHSYQLTPGGTFSCINGGVVITETVSLTAATANHAYIATEQQ